MPLKMTPADVAFALCVLERANYTCERCGLEFLDRDIGRGLDTSHFYGRANDAVRLDPNNADAFCRTCHQYMGRHYSEYRLWKKETLGAERWLTLQMASNDIGRGKIVNHSDVEIAAHYRRELALMLILRSMGTRGRIEFNGYF